MGKSIVAFIITIALGVLFTGLGEPMEWVELGNLMATAVMGGFIIYFNNNKK